MTRNLATFDNGHCEGIPAVGMIARLCLAAVLLSTTGGCSRQPTYAGEPCVITVHLDRPEAVRARAAGGEGVHGPCAGVSATDTPGNDSDAAGHRSDDGEVAAA